jgi:two-component system OmpR family sensor kinase
VHVVVTADDSGPGIAETEPVRVFDRFYQVPGSEVSGSGLDIAIIKTIAEFHGAQKRLYRAPILGGLRVELIFTKRLFRQIPVTRLCLQEYWDGEVGCPGS